MVQYLHFRILKFPLNHPIVSVKQLVYTHMFMVYTCLYHPWRFFVGVVLLIAMPTLDAVPKKHKFLWWNQGQFLHVSTHCTNVYQCSFPMFTKFINVCEFLQYSHVFTIPQFLKRPYSPSYSPILVPNFQEVSPAGDPYSTRPTCVLSHQWEISRIRFNGVTLVPYVWLYFVVIVPEI